MNVIYYTSTVVTRHMLDAEPHARLREAVADGQGRKKPTGSPNDWVVVRLDSRTPVSREVVAASSETAADYARAIGYPISKRCRIVHHKGGQ